MPTYIIQAGPTGPVKIGRADDPESRLVTLQTGHPDELRIIRLVDTAFDSEGAFHEEFAHLRLRGEWFRFHPDMMTFVPPEPIFEPPVEEIVRRAKQRALTEAGELLHAIWAPFASIETRGRFHRRIGKMLDVKPRRIRALMSGEKLVRVDVHEIEGLRAIARKMEGRPAGEGQLPRTVPPVRQA